MKHLKWRMSRKSVIWLHLCTILATAASTATNDLFACCPLGKRTTACLLLFALSDKNSPRLRQLRPQQSAPARQDAELKKLHVECLRLTVHSVCHTYTGACRCEDEGVEGHLSAFHEKFQLPTLSCFWRCHCWPAASNSRCARLEDDVAEVVFFGKDVVCWVCMAQFLVPCWTWVFVWLVNVSRWVFWLSLVLGVLRQIVGFRALFRKECVAWGCLWM